MALKLIFMGTPDFAVPILKSIILSKHEILTVYTQPPRKSNRGQKTQYSSVHKYSQINKLSVRYPNEFDFVEQNHIKKLKPDVVVVAAYGKLLPKNIINLRNIKFINVHASLLPRWRGAAPIQRSIIEMDKETGVSIMKIESGLDTGPYMLQEKVKIKRDDNFKTLSNKLSILGSKMILKALNLIEKNNFNFKAQDESKATYAKKISKKESEINWNISASKLIAKINGLNPSPGAWFKHKDIRLKIIEAVEVEKFGEIGTILDNDLIIGCKKNSIQILAIQKEGKKILKTKDFLAGYKFKLGEKLY